MHRVRFCSSPGQRGSSWADGYPEWCRHICSTGRRAQRVSRLNDAKVTHLMQATWCRASLELGQSAIGAMSVVERRSQPSWRKRRSAVSCQARGAMAWQDAIGTNTLLPGSSIVSFAGNRLNGLLPLPGPRALSRFPDRSLLNDLGL